MPYPISSTARSSVSAAPIGSSTWLVAVVSPSFRMFLRRSSTGSMPIAAATESMCCSTAQHACGAVGARTEPDGVVFVYARLASTETLGMRYGPTACIAASCGKKGASAL